MLKLVLGGLVVLLLIASVALWMLRPGSPRMDGRAAPDFELRDQHGKVHRLADYAGHWLVLYFYPRDDTPGCTEQACRLRDDIGVLGGLDAAVVGVSVDDVASHAAFAQRHRLPFPLLADADGRVAAAYGCLLNLGVMRFARRQTFIIDPAGRIAVHIAKVDPATHVEQVAQALQALRTPPAH